MKLHILEIIYHVWVIMLTEELMSNPETCITKVHKVNTTEVFAFYCLINDTHTPLDKYTLVGTAQKCSISDTQKQTLFPFMLIFMKNMLYKIRIRFVAK